MCCLFIHPLAVSKDMAGMERGKLGRAREREVGCALNLKRKQWLEIGPY